jgi:hypothetical protein
MEQMVYIWTTVLPWHAALDPLIRFTLDEKPLTGPNHVRMGEAIYDGTVSLTLRLARR